MADSTRSAGCPVADRYRRMSGELIARLESQLGGPRDGALLRFSLANAHAAAGHAEAALEACRAALDFDPQYSAAWKLLGRLLAQTGDVAGAIAAYERGIAAAAARGDVQAGREMGVFLRRLTRPATPD